jgi:hypothetical protein
MRGGVSSVALSEPCTWSPFSDHTLHFLLVWGFPRCALQGPLPIGARGLSSWLLVAILGTLPSCSLKVSQCQRPPPPQGSCLCSARDTQHACPVTPASLAHHVFQPPPNHRQAHWPPCSLGHTSPTPASGPYTCHSTYRPAIPPMLHLPSFALKSAQVSPSICV